jgi:uncharacterized protein (TIGR03066 family)
MAVLRAALVGCLLLAVASVGLAQKEKTKIDSAKLLGVWTFVKTTSKNAPPPGATFTVEFAKEGKFTFASTFKGTAMKQSGTWSVKGDQLTTTMAGPGGKSKSETVTISVLTDKKFVTTEKEGDNVVTTEFKK